MFSLCSDPSLVLSVAPLHTQCPAFILCWIQEIQLSGGMEGEFRLFPLLSVLHVHSQALPLSHSHLVIPWSLVSASLADSRTHTKSSCVSSSQRVLGSQLCLFWPCITTPVLHSQLYCLFTYFIKFILLYGFIGSGIFLPSPHFTSLH